MSETKPETGTEEQQNTAIQNLADRVDKLTGLVEKALGSGQAQGPPSTAPASTGAQPADLQAQIDAAVAKVTQARDADDAKTKHDAEHEQLRAAAAEKPPVERKRVHRLMGWGEPAQ